MNLPRIALQPQPSAGNSLAPLTLHIPLASAACPLNYRPPPPCLYTPPSCPRPQADGHLENAKYHAKLSAEEAAKAAKAGTSDLKGRSAATAGDVKGKAASFAEDAKAGAKSAAGNIKGAVKHGLHEAEDAVEGAAAA